MLISHGAEIEATDHVGQTPLAEACANSTNDNEHTQVADLLIAKGAKVNCKNQAGRTPLQQAGDGRVATVLRKHGATQ